MSNARAFYIGMGIGAFILMFASGLWFLFPALLPFFMDWSGDGDGRERPTRWDDR